MTNILRILARVSLFLLIIAVMSSAVAAQDDCVCGLTYEELLAAQQNCKRQGLVFAEDICMCSVTPIIIDTHGDGLALTSPANGVDFRIVPAGQLRRVAWTQATSDDGFLVLDRNSNGKIDDMTELFGNVTEQPPGAAQNGFLALAEFDKPQNGGNGDGAIDNHDAVFGKLRIWIDRNHNGLSEPSELLTLTSLGIERIGLDYREFRHQDEFGNIYRYRSRVNKGDDNSRVGSWVYDVLLRVQN